MLGKGYADKFLKQLKLKMTTKEASDKSPELPWLTKALQKAPKGGVKKLARAAAHIAPLYIKQPQHIMPPKGPGALSRIGKALQKRFIGFDAAGNPLTEQQLMKIIKEEFQKVLVEGRKQPDSRELEPEEGIDAAEHAIEIIEALKDLIREMLEEEEVDENH